MHEAILIASTLRAACIPARMSGPFVAHGHEVTVGDILHVAMSWISTRAGIGIERQAAHIYWTYRPYHTDAEASFATQGRSAGRGH